MIAAAPRLSPGARAWLWVLIAALAWTMQVLGTSTYTEALTADREVVATDRGAPAEEVSRRAEPLLRRSAHHPVPSRRARTTLPPAPRPCARAAGLQTLLCVWRT
ncbi:hypothetical protein ACWDLG_08065 [Nonomuraea sp. NPDC003727]